MAIIGGIILAGTLTLGLWRVKADLTTACLMFFGLAGVGFILALAAPLITKVLIEANFLSSWMVAIIVAQPMRVALGAVWIILIGIVLFAPHGD